MNPCTEETCQSCTLFNGVVRRGGSVAFYKSFESLLQEFLISGAIDPFYEAALQEGWYMGTVVDIALNQSNEKYTLVTQPQQKSSADCAEFYNPNNKLPVETIVTFLIDSGEEDRKVYTRSNGRKMYIGDRVKVKRKIYDRYMYGILIEIGEKIGETEEIDPTRGRVFYDQLHASEMMDLELAEPTNPEALGPGHWRWHGSTAARIDVGVGCNSHLGPFNEMRDAEKRYKDWIFPESRPFLKSTITPQGAPSEEVVVYKDGTNLSFVFDLEFIIKHSRDDIGSRWDLSSGSCHHIIQPSAQWIGQLGVEVASSETPNNCNSEDAQIIKGTVANAREAARRLPGEYEFRIMNNRVNYRRQISGGFQNPPEACCVLGEGSFGTHCNPAFADDVRVSGLLNFQKTLVSLGMSRQNCGNQMTQHCHESYANLISPECDHFMQHGPRDLVNLTLVKYCETNDGKKDDGCLCVIKPPGMWESCGNTRCFLPRSDEDQTLVSDANADLWNKYENSVCMRENEVDEYNDWLVESHQDAIDLSQAVEGAIGAIEIKKSHVIGVIMAAILIVVNLVYIFVPAPKSKRSKANPIFKIMIFSVISITIMAIYFIYTDFTLSDLTNIGGAIQSDNFKWAPEGDADDDLELVDWNPPKDDENYKEIVAPNYCLHPGPCSQYDGFVSVGELIADKDTKDTVPFEYRKDMKDCCLPEGSPDGGREPNWWDDPNNMGLAIALNIGIGLVSGRVLDYLISKKIIKDLTNGHYPRRARTAYRTLFKIKGDKADILMPKTRQAADRLMRQRMNSNRAMVTALTKNLSRRLPTDRKLRRYVRMANKDIKVSKGSVTAITRRGVGARRYIQRAMFASTRKFTKSYGMKLVARCMGIVLKRVGFAAKAVLGFATRRALGFAKMAGGPISAIWLIFDLASMAWDEVDDANLSTFKSNRSMLETRDRLDGIMWDSRGTFSTMSAENLFPNDWNRAYVEMEELAVFKAIEQLSEDEEWSIGYQAYLAARLSNPEYDAEFWYEQISERLEVIFNDMDWVDRESARLLAKHIYISNYEPATVRAYKQCSWWMLARPRLRCVVPQEQWHASTDFGSMSNCGSTESESQKGSDVKADINISDVKTHRGIEYIEISGYDADSSATENQLKGTMVAIRLKNMTYDEAAAPVLPDPDEGPSLAIWTEFLCILAEQPGWAFDPTTADVCEQKHFNPPVVPCEKDENEDVAGPGCMCGPNYVALRSIFRTTGHTLYNGSVSLTKGMWAVMAPRPWHDLEYQIKWPVDVNTSRLIEVYAFRTGSTGKEASKFYRGFGLSKIGCDMWNRVHYTCWTNESAVRNVFGDDLVAMSKMTAVYTDNYGKSLGKDDDGKYKIEKQTLPGGASAALAMVDYGKLMVQCNGNIQNALSIGPEGKSHSRTRWVDANGNVVQEDVDVAVGGITGAAGLQKKKFGSNAYGDNRLHLLPEFDYRRRMCGFTDAWCRSYGLPYKLCKEGEGDEGCTDAFTKENCKDPQRYPDCINPDSQRWTEFFFGENVTRRIFKPVAALLSGEGDAECYDDEQDIDTCDTLGVDPFSLKPKCWDESNGEHCKLKTCFPFGESF